MKKSIILFACSLFLSTFSSISQEMTKLGTTVNFIQNPSNSIDDFVYLGQIGTFHYGYDDDIPTLIKSSLTLYKLDANYKVIASNEVANLFNLKAQSIEIESIKIINDMITVFVTSDDKKADRTFIEVNTISPETLQKTDTKTILDVPQISETYSGAIIERFSFSYSNTPSGEYVVAYQDRKNDKHTIYFVNGDHSIAHTEEFMHEEDMQIVEFNIDPTNFGFLATFDIDFYDESVYFNFNRESQKLTPVEFELNEECPNLISRTAITQNNQLLVIGFSRIGEPKKTIQKKCIRFYDLESGELLKEAYYPTNHDSEIPAYAEDEYRMYEPNNHAPCMIYVNPDGTFNFISQLYGEKSHTSSNGVTTTTYYFCGITNDLINADGDFVNEIKSPRYFKSRSYNGKEGTFLPYLDSEGLRIIYLTTEGLEITKFDKNSGQTSTEKLYPTGYKDYLSVIDNYNFDPNSIINSEPGVFWVPVFGKTKPKDLFLTIDFNP